MKEMSTLKTNDKGFVGRDCHRQINLHLPQVSPINQELYPRSYDFLIEVL